MTNEKQQRASYDACPRCHYLVQDGFHRCQVCGLRRGLAEWNRPLLTWKELAEIAGAVATAGALLVLLVLLIHGLTNRGRLASL